MADLHNDSKTLRFRFQVVDAEVPAQAPGLPTRPGIQRLLGRVGMEHFDRRDGCFWPFIHLAVYWSGAAECEELLESLTAFIRGESPGFAFRSALSPELGLQVGRDEQGRPILEVGFDLGSYLHHHAGAGTQPGESLALFRFPTTQAELVSFAHALKAEKAEVIQDRSQSQPTP